MNRIKLEGTQVNDIFVNSYLGSGYYNCICKCGKTMKIAASSLLKGYKTKCIHKSDFSPGDKVNEWTIIEQIDSIRYKCKCSCGKTGVVSKYDLKSGKSKSCGHNKLLDLEGKQIGNWTVLGYAGNGEWLCECLCGNRKVVNGASLRNGTSLSCGHSKSEVQYDLKGKVFGEWTVLNYAGYNKWHCRCSCGKEADIGGFQLRNHLSQSCGHDYNEFKDLTGKQFGELQVLNYLGNQQFLCRCSCGNIITRAGKSLRNGSSKSCGHLKSFKVASKMNSDRTNEQLEAALSKEKFREFIGDSKPNLLELANLLGVSYSHTARLCKKYNSEDLIDLSNQTYLENDLYNYIRSIYTGDIIRHDRSILSGKELDIYIPDRNLAIEFNGTYWHSTVYKDKKYHQQKTLDCTKQGIRLIHIFEYEWVDEIQGVRLKSFLADILQDNTKIYARNVKVTEIDSKESVELLERYHLQGSTPAKINIGLYSDYELVAVMTFGKPRFNNNFQYELLRMCFKPGVTVIGGKEKMFRQFINRYNPKSIICYSDIAKFTGKGYLSLGFKPCEDMPLTDPGYIWVDPTTNNIISRYQTQKNRLVKLGYSEIGNTESEIMENLGYLKIYDCGNVRFRWGISGI